MAPSGPGDSGARLLVSLGLDCSWQEPAVAVGPPAPEAAPGGGKLWRQGTTTDAPLQVVDGTMLAGLTS